jgi:hypothetical protein
MRRFVILVSLFVVACDESGEPAAIDAARTADSRVDGASADGPSSPDGSGTDGVPGVDGTWLDGGSEDGSSSIDASWSGDGGSACSGFAREACESDESCLPACFSICDCTCTGSIASDPCGGCPACPKECMYFASCEVRKDYTLCGPDGLFCPTATHVCLRREAGIGFFHSCEPVPLECKEDRSCDCLADDFCTDVACEEAGDNTIACTCPLCP